MESVPRRRERAGTRSLSQMFETPIDVRSVALTGLFVLALVYTTYFARSFLMPIVLALLLSFLLAPVVRALKRVGIPESIGAGVVLVTLVGAALFGVYRLTTPASAWKSSPCPPSGGRPPST